MVVIVVIDEADEESPDAIGEHGLALSTNKLFHFCTEVRTYTILFCFQDV